jgi:hypothetical protein
MFAAYCLQLQHTGQVPAYLYEEISELRKQDPDAANAYSCMAKLKLAIAKNKACTDPPRQRAKMAEALERQGKPYEALVHRLRCADILDDGSSKHQLAKLYFKLNEKKLGFETLRDAAEKSWAKSQSDELSDVHYLMGKYIHELAKDAEKHGNDELRMLRLRNASACLRRAVCLDRYNREANSRLMQVAREAASLDNSFDNQLLIGSTNLIAGDLERADNAYRECTTINKQEPRLKEAKQLLAAIAKKQAAFDSTTAKPGRKTTGRLASGKNE